MERRNAGLIIPIKSIEDHQKFCERCNEVDAFGRKVGTISSVPIECLPFILKGKIENDASNVVYLDRFRKPVRKVWGRSPLPCYQPFEFGCLPSLPTRAFISNTQPDPI